jgi:hypothetical protein
MRTLLAALVSSQLGAALRTLATRVFAPPSLSRRPFCSSKHPLRLHFNESGAFTLINNFSSANIMTINVPAGSVQPPGPPTLLVVATGCTTCHAGNPLPSSCM